MSLVLAVGNPDHAIVVADRGLRTDASLVADGSNDPALVLTRDARLGLTFTGLARTDGFETRSWLLLAIHSAMQSGMQLSFERLCQLGDLQWGRLRSEERRFTAVLAGFVQEGVTGLMPALGIVSNWELPPDMDETKEIDDKFRSVWWRHTALGNYAESFAIPAGLIEAVTEDEIAGLKALAAAAAPADDIVARAVTVIRAASERPEAEGAITGDAVSFVLPRDQAVAPIMRLHTAAGVSDLGQPTVVTPAEITDPRVTASSEGAFAATKIGRNSACPCGSGKKFKWDPLESTCRHASLSIL